MWLDASVEFKDGLKKEPCHLLIVTRNCCCCFICYIETKSVFPRPEHNKIKCETWFFRWQMWPSTTTVSTNSYFYLFFSIFYRFPIRKYNFSNSLNTSKCYRKKKQNEKNNNISFDTFIVSRIRFVKIEMTQFQVWTRTNRKCVAYACICV